MIILGAEEFEHQTISRLARIETTLESIVKMQDLFLVFKSQVDALASEVVVTRESAKSSHKRIDDVKKEWQEDLKATKDNIYRTAIVAWVIATFFIGIMLSLLK